MFLRGVNVGGRTLATKTLAEELADLGARSLGAAGTFTIEGRLGIEKVQERFRQRIPFPTEVIVVPRTVLAGLLARPARKVAADEAAARRSVTFLAREPARSPRLPMDRPVAGDWEVRLTERLGAMVLGLHLRRRPDRVLYANEVVEREFGVPATTRWWETVESVLKAFPSVD